MAASSRHVGPGQSFTGTSSSTEPYESALSFESSTTPKQKRRRTSPRDHAILEAAYQRNSKPDKHERGDIVSQVELGEKEVQIWFQNRRQNDRRKSKPLQPHELLAHMRNGIATPIVPQNNTSDGSQGGSLLPPLSSKSELSRPLSRSSNIVELLNPPSSAETTLTPNSNYISSQDTNTASTPPSSFREDIVLTENKPQEPASVLPAPRPARSHGRKRSHEVMLETSSTGKPDVTAGETTVQAPSRLLNRSSSFIRLAMTVDGAVKVRTNDEATPSPPKKTTSPLAQPGKKRESFGRSKSAIENSFVFKDINPPIQRVGSAGFGRSRDARTWEFYCDRDAGETLSTQAEAERSGSAVGAINLIRSRSQRSKNQALSPNLSKQNTRRSYTPRNNNKPQMSRAKSSLARLENFDGSADAPDSDAKRAKHERSPSGDSDKENWAPGTRNSLHSMRRAHPSESRSSVLQENGSGMIRGSIDNTACQQQENRGQVVKEKAKGDDLDCINGLLSLSQGLWQ